MKTEQLWRLLTGAEEDPDYLVHQVNDSSIIEAIGYNLKTNTLLVLFYKEQASIYAYPHQKKEVFDKLKNAPSVGSAFRALNLTLYSRII